MKKGILYKSTFVAALIGCSLLFTTTSQADISSDAQVQGLKSLARFEGINPNELLVQQPEEGDEMNPVTLQTLEQAARNDGIEVTDQKISLPDLRNMDAPAIAILNDPEELVTIAAIGQRDAIVYDGAALQIMPVKVLMQRYDGEALLYKHHLHQKPQVVVDEPVRDIKINTIGNAFPFSVPVKNTGNDTVTLKVQSTSCGCTSDDQSVHTLKPGQSGELHFKTTTNTDRVVTAMIATSDPAKPVFELTFQITVPKTTIQPVSGVLLNGGIGKTIHASFPLTLPAGVSVAKLTSSQPFVTAKLLSVSKQANNNISQVGVTVNPNAPAGSFSDGITVLLRGGDIKSVTVPVDVYFTPAMISLDKLKAGSSSTYQVTLQSPIHQKFAITDWNINNPAIEVQAHRNVKSDVQHLTVQVHAPQTATMLNGRISFTLSDGRQINLDVIGNVAG